MCSTVLQIIYNLLKDSLEPMVLLPAPAANKELAEFSRETRDASPAHLLTTIDSFPMLLKHGIMKFESTEFEAGDYKWKVIVNIDGSEHISVKLSMVGTSSLPAGREVNAIFNFFLYNHISNKYTCFRGKARRFHAIDSEWGFSKLVSIKDLKDPSNGYLLKDKCVFGAEVFVIKNQSLVEKMSVLRSSNPYKHEWRFSNFFKLGSTWKSEEFSAGGYKWYIEMHPNGNGRASGSYVSIFFTCVDAKSFPHGKKVNASCFFILRNKINHLKDHSLKAMEWFTSTNPSWGLTDFKAIDDMRDPSKGFVIKDCCNLEIQLSVLAVQES